MAVPSLKLINGYSIPIVGLGTFTVTDEKELETTLNAALEAGYRHIDTATLYQNEHIIGRVLKRWFDSKKLKREDIFITTKLPPAGIHPDRVEGNITKSLEKLQLDYLDLYLIHVPICGDIGAEPEPTDHIAVWKKLEEQVELGRTRAIGVSNFNKEQVSRIIANSKIKPASNQIELHVYLQQPELVKYLQDNGIVTVAYSSLGNPGMNDFLKKHGFPQRKFGTELLDDPTVNRIATKYRKSSAQILLKFLVQKNIVVIPKSVSPKRVLENFSLFDFTLDSGDIKTLEGLDQGEAGRRSTFAINPAILNHPEYPFPRIPKDH